MQKPKISKTPSPLILIVDDSHSFTRMTSRYLNQMGLSVKSAFTAEDAVKLVSLEKFDAILLDDALPGMMGVRAIGELKKYTRAPVIFITGYPSDQLRDNALALGASAFLKKPLTPGRLYNTILKFINAQNWEAQK